MPDYGEKPVHPRISGRHTGRHEMASGLWSLGHPRSLPTRADWPNAALEATTRPVAIATMSFVT
jgi:hypothetical protein